jgi:hypothetical protein
MLLPLRPIKAPVHRLLRSFISPRAAFSLRTGELAAQPWERAERMSDIARTIATLWAPTTLWPMRAN